jgi:ABC-type transporter Mla subunit MlaD
VTVLRSPFRGRPVGKQRGRAFMAGVGIAALVIAAVTFVIGYRAAETVPGRGYYDLHAVFSNAENLANHYEVRIGGVRAGQILRPRVKDGKAFLDLRLDDKYKPLRSDTELRVRLRSAVGVRYLEIFPGTKGRPLPAGAVIPVENTVPPVALDKVLGIFDARTREKTRTFLNELGAGTNARSADVNETLSDTPELLARVGSFSQAIVERPKAVERFVNASDGAADAFHSVRREIADGFEPEARALRPFTEARTEVQRTLSEAAPALDELRAGLPAVSRLVDQAAKLARDGTPTLSEAPRALASTTALLRDGRRPLAEVKRTLVQAGQAVPPTLALLDRAKPVLPALERTFADLRPTVEYVSPRACDISNAMTGWNQWMKWRDAYGNFIRFQALAARASVLVGGTSKPIASGPDGKDLVGSFYHDDPYSAGCNGQYGEAGSPRPTVAESVKGLTYTRNRQPGFEAPGYHGVEGGG